MSVKQLRKNFFWKYVFQLFLVPVIFGIFVELLFVGIKLLLGEGNEIFKDLFIDSKFAIYGWVWGFIFAILINFSNSLSLPTFIKLLYDCIKRHEIEATIKINKLFPIYELQSIRQKKRFICDTFSRKANVEIYIYDEDGKKYRFLWNENYGGNSEDVERVLLEDVAIKIRYMKYSKIIVSCKMINDDA